MAYFGHFKIFDHSWPLIGHQWSVDETRNHHHWIPRIRKPIKTAKLWAKIYWSSNFERYWRSNFERSRISNGNRKTLRKACSRSNFASDQSAIDSGGPGAYRNIGRIIKKKFRKIFLRSLKLLLRLQKMQNEMQFVSLDLILL